MFGAETEHLPLEWEWAESRLVSSGTYWVTPGATTPPHPRPVWGVWTRGLLALSVGSPVVRRGLEAEPRCTVHLPDGIEVVIVDGELAGSDADPELVALYDAKYDWQYSVADYGPLTVIRPVTVTAWLAVGPDGRDGFERSGRWAFDEPRPTG